MSDGPVPGRECGDCVVCCVLFEVQELQKPAGKPCRHLAPAGGCGIYETRPQACRVWMCGWRLIPGLPENWRPDLSGILVYQMPCTEPGYGPDAFVLALTKGADYLADASVLGFIQNMVARRVPLYLTLTAGRADARAAFLNEMLTPPVQANDAARFVAILARLIEAETPA